MEDTAPQNPFKIHAYISERTGSTAGKKSEELQLTETLTKETKPKTCRGPPAWRGADEKTKHTRHGR